MEGTVPVSKLTTRQAATGTGQTKRTELRSRSKPACSWSTDFSTSRLRPFPWRNACPSATGQLDGRVLKRGADPYLTPHTNYLRVDLRLTREN